MTFGPIESQGSYSLKVFLDRIESENNTFGSGGGKARHLNTAVKFVIFTVRCIVLETTIYEILSAIDIDNRLNMDLEYDLDPPPRSLSYW